jgi:predicted DNA-binding transcriptional regulator AlpA
LARNVETIRIFHQPPRMVLFYVMKNSSRRVAEAGAMTTEGAPAGARAGDDKILTADEAAGLLRITKRALYELNQAGTGPARRKVGREVHYWRSDVLDWFDSLPAL